VAAPADVVLHVKSQAPCDISEFLDRSDQRQPGTNGLLFVVFMGCRIAETDQDAVADWACVSWSRSGIIVPRQVFVQRQLREVLIVPRFAPIALFVLFAATPAVSQSLPDLRGTWKGESEAIIWGKASKHQPPAESTDQARLLNVPLTLTVDKQDGRRFSATLTSPRATERLVGIVSRTGTVFLADDDGTDYATLLGPDKIEICHLRSAMETRHAACAELTRQP
jgi:hypothetical protein